MSTAGTIAGHLPALQVVAPLLAAPACALLGRGGRGAWWVAALVNWAAFLIAAVLLARVLAGGSMSYALGGWAPPWGIELRVDEVNAFVLLLVTATSALAVLFARDGLGREVAPERHHLFYAAWLLCLTGLLGITVTGDAFNVFVFLEISSLATYTLVSLGRDRRALTAAFRYLVMGTVGATFILIGVGLLYVTTGTLNMADLARRLPTVHDTRTVHAAFGFLTVGIALKMALFPLHAWLPGAYTYAPSAASAFLAASATKVAVYLWLRFLYTVFGFDFAFDAMQVGRILMALSLVAIIAGSVAAVYQRDAKQMLAWSSVAQIGYIVLGVSFASLAGLTAAIVHVFNHGLIKATLFLAVGCVVHRIGTSAIVSFAGLARNMPLTMAAALVGALSLVGVPLTAGFVSKWLLLAAALEQGLWSVEAVVVATSLLAVVYVWRHLEPAWFDTAAPGSLAARATEAPPTMLLAVWVAAAANLYFGLHTSLTVGVADQAARALMGAAR